MIVTLGLLWRFVAPRTEFPLKVKTAEFWLVAITLSLLTALTYPVVTGWRGVSRNYLEGYGLSDVVWVWFASVVFATVAYFVVAGGINLCARIVKWYRSWEARQRTPSAKDTPITVLRKLHKQNLGISRDRVDVKVEGELQRAYLLEPWEEDREKIWVGPNIVVEWLAGADTELQQKVEEQLGPRGSAVALAALLEEGLRRGDLRVRWKRMGQLAGPYEARTANLKRVPPPNVIVEQE